MNDRLLQQPVKKSTLWKCRYYRTFLWV